MKTEVRTSLLTLSASGSAVDATLRFDAGLSVFAGHFPGHPLVPAVYLIEAARQLGEGLLGRAGRIARVEDARFLRPVLPGEALAARLTGRPAEDGGGRLACEARFTVDGAEAARVRLVLAPSVPGAERVP